MPMLNLNIGEEDVVRLILEFLHTRELHITQLSLERETGVINGNYADDVLFLRQLILDGQWEDVLEFIQPLSILQDFQTNKFNFVILKHQFIELLCMKSEIKVPNNVKNIVDDVVQVLNKIEKIAPSRDEYSNLCLLLTLPSITDHAQFKKWNPSDARIKCFQEVYPLVEQFLPMTSNAVVPKSAKNDRLMNLIIKGILYEACVNYCQSKATGTQEAHLNSVDFSDMLEIPGFDESDLSLLSWLQSIPFDIFSIPFEQRSLNVELERLVRPALHTSWTEHMLVTPIKPGKFPHLAMPFRRPRSAADAMTRSLRPLPDGAPRHPAAMALSAIDYGPSTSYFAGFHLTGIRDSTLMNTSVDRLFEGQNEDLNEFNPNARSSLQPIEEQTRTPGDNSNSHIGASKVTTREHRPPTDEAPIASAAVAPIPPPQGDVMPVAPSEDGEITRERLNEYRVQMQRECDDYLRNLCSSEIRTDNSMDQSVNLNDAFIESQSESQTEAQLEADMNITEPSADSPPTLHDEPSSSNAENDAVVAGSSGVMRVISGNRSRATSTPTHLPVPPIVAILQDEDNDRPTFKPVTALEDLQAIRCAEFHPNGMLYAVGSNTKNLRICKYPKMDEVKPDKLSLPAPTVLLKRTKHHKGSIYCLAWSPAGNLLATGSNDKTVKLMRFNSETCNLEGQEVELSMHDGTVRDVCFIEDTINKASLLVSGGAGDCNIYVTDCATGRLFQTMTGHTGHVLSLYTWGGAMFVSSSQDKTARFWDLRIGGCVNTITSTATLGAVVGAGVAATGSVMTSLALDPSGRLLVCGNENGCCELYDVRGSRALQRFFPHTSDVRSVRFSPGAYYLLTASYDGQIMLTDMQGDLTCVLPSVLVARHHDKVISARWHPEDFSFLSTSADRTAVLWTIPQ